MKGARVKVKTVPKPWGHETWYACGRHYAGKILQINKGHRLSLQYHRVKHETIYALKGRFVLRLGAKDYVIAPGTAVEIRPGTKHRFEARYGRVTLLEVSTPELRDIVRLEDDYGRAKRFKPVKKKRG